MSSAYLIWISIEPRKRSDSTNYDSGARTIPLVSSYGQIGLRSVGASGTIWKSSRRLKPFHPLSQRASNFSFNGGNFREQRRFGEFSSIDFPFRDQARQIGDVHQHATDLVRLSEGHHCSGIYTIQPVLTLVLLVLVSNGR
jgi:hypothetical protein